MEGYTSNTFLISTAFLGVLKRMAAESKSKSNKNKDIMNIIDLLLSSWLPSTITTSHTCISLFQEEESVKQAERTMGLPALL